MSEQNKVIPLAESIRHWRQLSDSNYIGAWDLPENKAVSVTIQSVQQEEVMNPASKQKEVKTVVRFKGKSKGLILNKTNAEAIASHHGDNPHTWSGKDIELFATTTKCKGEVVDCIRVKKATGPKKRADFKPL